MMPRTVFHVKHIIVSSKQKVESSYCRGGVPPPVSSEKRAGLDIREQKIRYIFCANGESRITRVSGRRNAAPTGGISCLRVTDA